MEEKMTDKMANKNTEVKKSPSRFGKIAREAKHVGRIIAFLTREELDFIDKISKDALFTTGKRLTRTDVVQALVESAMKLDVSGGNIHTQDELEKRILEVARKGLPALAQELKENKQ